MVYSAKTPTQTELLIDDLMSSVRGDVLASPIDRSLYSTDASTYRIKPTCAIAPKDADDIATAIRTVREYGGSVVPRGGGTSLSGQSVGVGVVLDLSKYMNQIVEINPAQRWIEVQAGTALATVNTALAQHGLKIGPDPSSAPMATVGGMAGNNSTGSHSILYGMMADHVKEVEVVLSDGTIARFKAKTPEQLAAIIEEDTLEAKIYRSIPALVMEYADDIATRYPKTWRNVAGYNLNYIHRLISSGSSLNIAPLIVGSEGTLGVITSVKIGLVDVPKRTYLAVVHFNSLRESMEAVPLILEHKPSAVEFIDNYFINLSSTSPEWGAILPQYFRNDPAAVLIVEFYGDTLDDLTIRAMHLQEQLRNHGYHGEIVHLPDPAEVDTIWKIRKAGLGLMMSKRGDAKPLTFVDDATVPIEHLPAFAEEVDAICTSLNAKAAIIGHASAGCIHINPTLNTKTEDGIATMRQLSEKILQLAIKYEGSTTGEHGEGIARGYFNEQLYGERLHRAFRQVKGIFDPNNVMNPGKIIDAPEPWDASVIRLNPSYSTPYAPNVTWLDFSADGGFAGAVEMCNGQGVCRKTNAGIMCPSYMATRDERHSTRGRANALRDAISGELGSEGLINDELYDVLDLCLECKACQRECASVVDMAKLKSEFLAQYQQEKGVPLRSRIFANINFINKLSSLPIIRQLANWTFKNDLLRAWMEVGLGVAAKRSLPLIKSETFRQWFKKRSGADGPTKGKVILWDDTFVTYNEPEIGIAAVKLLEAAGYTVEILQGHDCCGRPMISKGLLQQAKGVAHKNVERLIPYVKQGIPIIGLEPSCVSAFRDEYPSLLQSDDARQVGLNTFFFEEFFSTILAEDAIEFVVPETNQTIHVHGHCHQRSLIGASAMMAMLSHLPNTKVNLIDSGCCGMAGSFGYESEHYDISLKIGEDRLFPTIRAAEPDAVIAAPGNIMPPSNS